MRISGRIDSEGTLSSAKSSSGFHSLLLRNGVALGLDGRYAEEISSLGVGDLCITGANLVDRFGRAAMLAGSPLGGEPLAYLPRLVAEGVQMVVTAGFEKQWTGNLDEALNATSRQCIDCSRGMAAGLIPLCGTVIDEAEALKLLGASSVIVVARGGLNEARGSVTLVASVEESRADEILGLVIHCNEIGALEGPSGTADSLNSCCELHHCGPTSLSHLACCYKNLWKRKKEAQP